jgi:ATP-binding cassette subfamily C protein CydCD
MHRRLLALTRDSHSALLFTVLSGFLAGLLIIGQAYLLSSVVNGVHLEGKTLAEVMPWLELILVIIAGRAFLTWINEVSANIVAVRIKTDLRNRLFEHILRLGPAYTRGQRTGELTTAAVEGIEALDAYYSQYLPQLVITALIPISILLVVFPIDVLSGIVMLVTAPLIPFFMIMIGKGAEIVTHRQYRTLSRLSAHFLDSLQGLTTLKLFGQSRAHAKNIEKVSNQFRDTTLSVLRITFLSALALELLATLSTAVIAVEIGFRLLYGRMEFLQAFFILVLAPEFYLPLRMLGARFHAGMSGTTAAKRIYEILDTPVPLGSEQLAEESQRQNEAVSSLSFENVSYPYPGEATSALENINLRIDAGEQIALIGKTGAGKSTLASLLLGFIQPTSGSIIINQSPITDYQLLPQIAWVPQRPYLFHDSIAANIRLGKPEATEQQVIEAARAAHLHEFIDTLPEKYETIIGESGARLSGGQAQRLALARAFLKDAPILILDEPTSSLDPETESLLEESTQRLMQGRTVITIAHRLNTIFKADLIVVLEQGRILEQGTHRELLAQNGVYTEMVEAYGMGSLQVESGKLKVEDQVPSSRILSDSKIAYDLQPFEDSQDKPSTLNIEPTINGPLATVHGRSIFFRLLSFLKGSWGLVALSVLLSTLTIGASVALIGTSAWLISTAALHVSVADLGVSVVGVRFFGISRGVFRYLERLVSHNVTFRLLARLRVWFYEKLEPLAPARLMQFRSGDLLARVIGDVETLENFYVRVISPSLTAVFTGLGVAFFFSFFYPPIALVLIVFFLLLGLILPLLAQITSRKPGQRMIVQRADIQTQLVDGIQGIADILAFGRGWDRARRISQTGASYGSTQKHMARISGSHSAMGTLLTNLGLWVVLVLVIPQVTAGNLNGVMIGTFALMTLASFEAVTPLPLAAQMWNASREAARRLFEVVDSEPAVKEDLRYSKIEPRKSNIEFSNLTFGYPGQPIYALQEVTFTVPEGKSVAIVGPSGAGKSTIASLLFRFWDYGLGDIRLGGQSLKVQNPEDIRKQIALVSQNSYFFNTSIRENLRLARWSTTPEEMEAAARAAQIHEFILKLPQGYATLIGEQGLRLSGGERQRLAIARALLKAAPIMVFDEPTANLDALTERQVLDTLFETMKDRTCLLITHRLLGLENMDEILVLDKGRIVERGTHSELLSQDGVYRRLFELQNQMLYDIYG